MEEDGQHLVGVKLVFMTLPSRDKSNRCYYLEEEEVVVKPLLSCELTDCLQQ